MVDHFVGGSGSDYSNNALTAAIIEHPNTQSHVNSVVNVIKEQISLVNGNIESLIYNEELWVQPIQRKSQIVVSALLYEKEIIGNESINLPVYGYNNGVAGLTLAVDSWYGSKIEIESFSVQGNTYSGTLRFTFYDHFGLDTSDLSEKKYGNLKAGSLPGFRQWYILQHWSELGTSVQPKPFVTVVSFTVPISGTF